MTRSLQAVAYRRPSVLESAAGGQRLGLETSRGATPVGTVDHPRFFAGFLTSPQVASAALLTTEDRQELLAESATRRRLVTEARLLRRELTLLQEIGAVPVPLHEFATPMTVN